MKRKPKYRPSSKAPKKVRREKDIHVETNYKVLYEDESFLGIDKPSPLPVHPVGRFTEKNLLSLLKRDFPQFAAGLRICNRLDSETSGIVIVAKSSEMAGRIGLLFEKRKVKKEYTAVVRGCPKVQKGTITMRLGTVHRGSLHMRKPDPLGETAITAYEVLKKGTKAALVTVRPETGRKHQIRAHFAFAGHPVLGDKVYIDTRIFEQYLHAGWQKDMLAAVRSERLLLHASRLEFAHPVSGKIITLVSEAPDFFESFL